MVYCGCLENSWVNSPGSSNPPLSVRNEAAVPLLLYTGASHNMWGRKYLLYTQISNWASNKTCITSQSAFMLPCFVVYFLDGRCTVSLIGTVEKIQVTSVLQRIETFTKTGLLVIKQDTQWVEFYCREGRLLCVGPIRTDATLGERLLQDNVISSKALQETMLTIGSAVPSETRIALILMDLGYVTREELRSWSTKKTEEVLSAVLSWSTGELHFDEDADPPSERLLVSLSISSLLAAIPATKTSSQAQPVLQHVAQEYSTTMIAEEPHTGSVVWDSSQAETLYDPSQFFTEPASPYTSPTTPYVVSGTLLPTFDNSLHTTPVMLPPPPQTPPPMPSMPMAEFPSTKSTNTPPLQPDMVLVAADLSTLPEQHLQVTPDQWRLLTRIDGRTSLQEACNVLNMRAEDVCRVASELIDEHIVQVGFPSMQEIQQMSPASQNLYQSGLSNGLATPGYATTMQSPWGNVWPVSDMIPQFSSTLETYSQWGNGGNGATFVPGQGWIAPVQPSGVGSGGMYTSMGSNR